MHAASESSADGPLMSAGVQTIQVPAQTPDWSKPTDGVTKSGLTPRTHCMFFGFEFEVIDVIDVPESPKRPGDEKLSTIS